MTCYHHKDVPALKRRITSICDEFGLDRNKFKFKQQDWFKPCGDNNDLVISNRVFGGLNREHDIGKFRAALEKASEQLNDDGHVVIVDKAAPIQPLRTLLQKYGTAGKNGWHYFSNEDFEKLVSRRLLLAPIERFGFLSVGNLKQSS